MRRSGLTRRSKIQLALGLSSILTFIVVAVPTIASQFGEQPAPNPTPSPSASVPISPEPSISSAPTNETATSPTTSASAAATQPSATPKPIPSALATDQQKFSVGIPSVVPVDPRAQTVYFPKISLQGNSPTLLCISSSNSNQMDIATRGIADDSATAGVLISGDTTGFVMLSGSIDAVVNAINGAGGFALYNYAKPISLSSLTFQIVAVSEPTLSAAFCGSARSDFVRRVVIKPLGITLDTRKGAIPLRSPNP